MSCDKKENVIEAKAGIHLSDSSLPHKSRLSLRMTLGPGFRRDDDWKIQDEVGTGHAAAISALAFTLPHSRSSRLATSSQASALASMMSLLVPVPSYSSP